MTTGDAASRAGRIAVDSSGFIVDLEMATEELSYGGDSMAAAVLELHRSAHGRTAVPSPSPSEPPSPSDDASDPLHRARLAADALHGHLVALADVRGVSEVEGVGGFTVHAEADLYGTLIVLSIDDRIRDRHILYVERAIVDAVNGAVHAATSTGADIRGTLRTALDAACPTTHC